MTTRLTLQEQLDRFGMTFEQANELKNRVAAKLSPKEVELARRAWLDLVEELREGKPQPMRSLLHPEALRFELLRGMDNGLTLEAAVERARRLAKEGEAA